MNEAAGPPSSRIQADKLHRPLRPARVVEALMREERFGIKLACYARFVAVFFLAFWSLLQNWNLGGWVTGYYLGVNAGSAAIGGLLLWLSGTRHWRPWHKYVIATVELCLLTFVLARQPPGAPFELPLAFQMRWDNELYFFGIFAGWTLTFSPLLVLWCGVAAALAWSGALLYVLSAPETTGFRNIGELPASAEQFVARVLDPNYVSPRDYITLIVIFLLVTGVLALGVWRARRLVFRQVEAERQRTNLSRYFSPNMVDELAHTDEPLGAARRQNAAILFADMIGFTPLSESLTPEETMGLLREFHGRMAEAVFAHSGTLDKYVGDEVMATFGTPRPSPHDAVNALACARDMQSAIGRWNVARVAAGAPPVRIGVGVHYGPVVLGGIGGEQRFEFAVIGDTVNVASRLERLSRTLGTDLVVSDAVIQQVRHELGATAVDTLGGLQFAAGHAIRGRRAPVDVWILGPVVRS